MPLYLHWAMIMLYCTIGYIHCNKLPDEQRLLLKLFDNYDTSVRPVYNSSKNVVVTFGFTLIQIMDMDEKNQVLITNAWLVMEWKDERISWNQSDFGDMSIVRIPARLLWLPDIVLYNNADDYTTGFMNVNAMVHDNGNVFWSPPVRLRSSCKVDITYFPFDTQICKLKFGSWTYDKAQVDLLNQADFVDVSSYVTNGEWRLSRFEIVRNETVYPIGDAVYPDVTVVLVIRRRVLYYVLNIIAPCFWLNILSVLNFALPPDAGEKMTLGITVLLSYSVFMLLVADSMPPTSEFVPLIGIYLTVSMAMSSVSVVLSVMVMKLHHCVPNQREVPPWVRRFVLKGLSSFLRCRCKPVCRFSRRRRVNMKPSAAAAERLADPTEMCTKLMNELCCSQSREVATLTSPYKATELSSLYPQSNRYVSFLTPEWSTSPE
ncbi:neuronal acetylcholine receptor subunit beta-4-like [Octopus vulgaris]|uniref:Neuronal acetylcholine receptor subunit beta-4-like n=1 Tax=Octopus vulgaris TaxID=6645 RepID=A0AA36ANH4_OCTVU|nr:neuronal acetylcholine receptor subunit beta-4-like [Octopus vulgaris]